MAPDRTIIFYDGACGLCHGFVLFVLKRDTEGRLRFAPLEGDTLRELVDAPRRATLPDSVVVRTVEGALLIRSNGVLEVARELGGGWRGLGAICRVVPRPLRDVVYDGVAKIRKRLFKKPDEACPIVPLNLRGRFLP